MTRSHECAACRNQNALIEEQERNINETVHSNNQAIEIGEILGEFSDQNFSEFNLPESLRQNQIQLTDFHLRYNQLVSQVIEKKFNAKKPLQCTGCLYYSNNEYLKCAVNPELLEGCQHFETELKL